MHARVLTIDTRAEELDEAIRLYEAVVVPTMRAHAGFRGLLFLTDREHGVVRSITLWEHAEDFIDETTYREVLGVFNDRVTVRSFQREHYDVSVRV